MVAGRLVPGRRRQGRAAAPCATSTRPSCPAPAGCGCGPASPASAAPTWPPSTARRRATSSRSCRSRSRPATRWSASSTTAPGSCSSRCSAASPAASPRSAAPCAAGRINHCERIAFGHLEPACRAGSASRTGGGWSTADGRPRAAARRRARRPDRRGRRAGRADRLRRPRRRARSHAGTRRRDRRRHPRPAHHRRPARTPAPTSRSSPPPSTPTSAALATELGADTVVAPGELDRAVRARTGSLRLDDGQLTGGVAAVVDCVGSAESIAQALRIAAPGGTIHVVGMPGVTTVDLTPLWHREIALRGAYAYERADFDTALELVADARPRPPRQRHLPAAPLRGRHRPRRLRRRPRRGEDRLRPPVGEGKGDHLMPRPGFVLDVDARRRRSSSTTARASGSRSCPPAARRVIYPAEPLERARRRRRRHPPRPRQPARRQRAAARAAHAGHEAHHRLRRHRRCRCRRCGGPTSASGSSRPCSTWPPPPASTTCTSSPPSPCTAA